MFFDLEFVFTFCSENVISVIIFSRITQEWNLGVSSDRCERHLIFLGLFRQALILWLILESEKSRKMISPLDSLVFVFTSVTMALFF